MKNLILKLNIVEQDYSNLLEQVINANETLIQTQRKMIVSCDNILARHEARSN